MKLTWARSQHSFNRNVQRTCIRYAHNTRVWHRPTESTEAKQSKVSCSTFRLTLQPRDTSSPRKWTVNVTRGFQWWRFPMRPPSSPSITALAYPRPSAVLPCFIFNASASTATIFYHSSLFLQTFPNIHLPLPPGSFRSFAKMFSFIIHLWAQVLVKRGKKETKKERHVLFF